MSKTFNRGKLLRLAKACRLMMIHSYHFDDQLGEERSNKEIPVRIRENHDDFKQGFCNLYESDFKSSCGHAAEADNGNVHLHVHSNCCYDFRVLAEPYNPDLVQFGDSLAKGMEEGYTQDKKVANSVLPVVADFSRVLPPRPMEGQRTTVAELNLTVKFDITHDLPWIIEDNRSVLRNERRAKDIPDALIIVATILDEHQRANC